MGKETPKEFFTESDCDVLSPYSMRKEGISVFRANALIRERSRVVYGWGERMPGVMTREWLIPSGGNLPIGSTHTALLINVEPIEQEDTAEKILEDLVKEYDSAFQHRGGTDYFQFAKRARKLLEKKGK